MSNGNGKNGNYLAAQFIAAIPGSGGIISTIARRVGCAWGTAQKYINKYATVRCAYEDEVSSVGDLAQSVVIGNMNQAIKALQKKQQDGETGQVDSSDAKWYLSRKVEGFEAKQEIGGTGDKGEVLIRLLGNVSPDDV